MFPIFKYSFISILFFSIIIISCSEDEKIDNEKPTITILTPANNSEFFVDDDVKITANSNDNIGISKVTLFVNGVIMATFDKSGIEYTLSSENRDPEISNITIYAEAEDMSGNIGVSNIINIKIITRPKGTLTGLVKNSTGVGIPDAKVVLSGDMNIEVRTNENGNFVIEDIEPGDYIITISKNYYEESADTITLNDNSNVYNVSLVSSLLEHVSLIDVQQGDQAIIVSINDPSLPTLAGYNIYVRSWYAHKDEEYTQNGNLYKVYSEWQLINSTPISLPYNFESFDYNASYSFYILPVNIDGVETSIDETTLEKNIDLPDKQNTISSFSYTESTDKITIPNSTHEVALVMTYFYSDVIEIFGFSPWSVQSSSDGINWQTVATVSLPGGNYLKNNYGYTYKFSLNQYKGQSLYFRAVSGNMTEGPEVTHVISEFSYYVDPFISTPTVTTNDITNITSNSATGGGNVIDNGGSTVIERGVCWSTSPNPTIDDEKTINGDGYGAFDSELTALAANTIYYIRAYAVNAAGTAYGNNVSFTSLTLSVPAVTTATPTNITASSADTGGEVLDHGGTSVTARGVCWNTSPNPTINESHTTDGGGTGNFTSMITGLSDNTTYYFRAYATNSAGTGYGDEISFTSLALSIPSVTTAAPTNITTSSADAGGEVTDDGETSITGRGVCWSTSPNPTTADSRTIDGTGIGGFTSLIIGLSDNTTYYLRAYATNIAGTGYGNDISFTTLRINSMPIVTTTVINNILVNSADCESEVLDDGGLEVTARGVVWSMTSSPTIDDNFTVDSSGMGIFYSSLIGLNVETTYYARSYASNSLGTSYGNLISFQTLNGGSFIDNRDNVEYSWIEIGSQHWMSENLKATKFNDGTAIDLVLDNTTWTNIATGAYCWFNNEESANMDTYGGLYNWHAVNTGKLCPVDWHVPTDEEWKILEKYLGMTQVEAYDWGERGTDVGDKLKGVGEDWGNTGTNESGFTALPSGFRRYDSGVFQGGGYWWSTTESFPYGNYSLFRSLGWYGGVSRSNAHWNNGFSVRCLRD